MRCVMRTRLYQLNKDDDDDDDDEDYDGDGNGDVDTWVNARRSALKITTRNPRGVKNDATQN